MEASSSLQSRYYLLTPEGYYYNFSGCGNTMNCNNAVVRDMILDCLRYWASAYHIDGFRFDLASILTRDQNGAPMITPPLLETIAYDPVLGKCKLIAEAWDAGGLYQVGTFPSFLAPLVGVDRPVQGLSAHLPDWRRGCGTGIIQADTGIE